MPYWPEWKKLLPLIWVAFVLAAFAIGGWQAWQGAASNGSEASTAARTETPLRVAVAANFLATAKKLGSAFEEKTGVPVQFSAASTGTLFAQISHGLPYDVFLAADSQRPQKLVETGLAHADTASTYAMGQLVYWSPKTAVTPTPDGHSANTSLPESCLAPLRNGKITRLVVANPSIAPYGLASHQAMTRLGLTPSKVKIITAENISQAFQVLISGNADAGFIARSQWQSLPAEHRTGCAWLLPASVHTPLMQQGVVLKTGTHPMARDFLAFLRSPQAQRLITQAGYAVE